MPTISRNPVRMGAAIALSICLISCSASTTPEQPSTLGQTASAEAMHAAIERTAGSGPIELHKIVAATWVVDRSGMINLEHPKAIADGIEAGLEDIELYVYVLRHPEHGDWIVDSGISEEFAQPDGSPRLGWIVNQAMNMDQLKVVSSTADVIDSMALDLQGVLITHLHTDHIMGVSDTPADTPVFAGPRETATRQFTHAFTQGTTDRLLDERTLLTWQFEDDPSAVYAGVIDIFGDGSLWAVHSPGHTEGSVAFVALTTSGAHLMLGDATHTVWGWENGVEPGTFSYDMPSSAASLKRLVDLAKRYPDMYVHPGHQSLKGASGKPLLR